jgi:TPR repeat protein
MSVRRQSMSARRFLGAVLLAMTWSRALAGQGAFGASPADSAASAQAEERGGYKPKVSVDEFTQTRAIVEQLSGFDAHANCHAGLLSVYSVHHVALTHYVAPDGSNLYYLSANYDGDHYVLLNVQGGAQLLADAALIELQPDLDAYRGGVGIGILDKGLIEEYERYEMTTDQLRLLRNASVVKMRLVGQEGMCNWQLDAAALGRLRQFVEHEVSARAQDAAPLAAGAIIKGMTAAAPGGTPGDECATGSPVACTREAFGYRTGHGVTRDDAKAVTYYQRACDGGDGAGCFGLAIMYDLGRGVAVDHERAARLNDRGCELGNGSACQGHALRLESDHPRQPFSPLVDSLLARAEELTEHGCANGDMADCLNLAVELTNGRSGAPPQLLRANDVLQRACDGGEPMACANLGYRYRDGSLGMPRDPSRGLAYLRQACALAVEAACRDAK